MVTKLALALLILLLRSLQAAPQRIVSTAPSFTETVFALGAGDRLVGVSTYCRFPAAAQKVTKIGPYLKPNVEQIVRLKPDLVIVDRDVANVSGQLNRFGIKTLAVSTMSLPQALESIQTIGAAIGNASEAQRLTSELQQQLSSLARLKPQRTLVFIVGRDPGKLEGMVAVGKGSYLTDLIQAAGGRNPMADSGIPYPTLSLESIIRLDPDVIVDMGDMADTANVPESQKVAVQALWMKQSRLKSVQQRRVFAVADDIFVVPGPRMVQAARALARMMYQD
jgi:iron complex transport system substrate-binding protein